MFEEVEVNSTRWFDLKDLFNERWKHIKGYEMLYDISNYGRVKRIGVYRISNRYYKKGRYYPTKIMTSSIGKHGYCCVQLFNHNGLFKTIRVHRLVAQSFIPNLDNKPQVNHKDGNKLNNRVDNLEWCTNGENGKHAWDNNLRTKNFGKDNYISKKILQYTPDKKLIKEWNCIKDISRSLGYNYGYIIACCQRKYKLGHNFIWRYKEEIENGMEI